MRLLACSLVERPPLIGERPILVQWPVEPDIL